MLSIANYSLMLSVAMLSVAMLSVTMLSVALLSVAMLSAILLIVLAPNVCGLGQEPILEGGHLKGTPFG